MTLLGIAEIAALANVSRQTVFNWIARTDDFPTPVASLACGQIWERGAVENWLTRTGRTRLSSATRPRFSKDTTYTFEDLKRSFGGDMQTYLPQVGSRIVCGCFNLQYNPNAPAEILVGRGPRIEMKAAKLVAQGGTLPVFLKHGTNHWQYVGNWKPLGLDMRQPILDEKRRAAGVSHPVTALLRLAPADT